MSIQLEEYIDANWARNVKDPISTFGFVISIACGVISWSSNKQATIALSSTKATYRGIGVVAREATWSKILLKDLKETIDNPILVFQE